MNAWVVVSIVALVPLAAAAFYERRARRELAALEAARLAEVKETVDAYEAEDEVTARMSSFSGYPFQRKHR